MLGNLPATRTTRVGGERARARRRPPRSRRPKAAAPKPKAAREAARRRKAAKPAAASAGPAARAAPVRAGAPALAESTERARSEASEPRARGRTPPSGTELVTTAIQAAGELAQIGLTVGGQVLKRAVNRLPKP